MGRFNLLDEAWISVLDEKTGKKKDVSMLELFRSAQEYHSLAGEMETQNFAVMRFLLSVVHTVFSRFDQQGNVHPGVILDEKWRQTEPVDEDDLDEYNEAVSTCWKQMFLSGSFPEVVFQYLEKWRERFYLFDDDYPFYQVNKKEMDEIIKSIPNKSKPTSIFGKNLNRTISESENKTALFSPVAQTIIGKRSKKDVMTASELTRWLIMFQGYSGLADKVSLTKKDQKSSKGWLFDLGGIYLRGSNVFETLMMNYLPESPNDTPAFSGRVQKPCWEECGSTVVDRLCRESYIDNLAELYTNWSRAVFIDPDTEVVAPVELLVVKIPGIDHTEKSIEPMTLWRRNDNGSNKNSFTPKKHLADRTLWRNFGIITMGISGEGEKQRQPKIVGQYQRLKDTIGSRWTDLVGVSMEDDGNSTSWLPIDEITDSFQINDLVITNTDADGWVIRINDAVETTKEVVSDFRRYLRGICEIRNLKITSPMDSLAEGFISEETQIMYSIIDPVFKEWLSLIDPNDSKEERMLEWNRKLRKLVLARGEALFENSTEKDLKGIEKEETGLENIATKYWQFVGRVNKKLGKEG